MEISHTPIPIAELEVFRALKNVRVVFDVGARADIDYLIIKPNIDLHAFEPFPLFFYQLAQRCYDTIGKGKIYLNNYGLGDVEGKFKFNATAQAFEKGEAPIKDGEIELPIKTLDWYVKKYNIKRIDFLKIDAEGYDYKVLLGGKSILNKCRYIQYEHWDNKEEYHKLLGKGFEMLYIGYRNVLCMNKKMVSSKTRKQIRDFITKNQFSKLS